MSNLSLTSKNNIASSFLKLGVAPAALTDPRAALKALETASTADVESVRKLREMLTDISDKDLKAIRATMGTSGTATTVATADTPRAGGDRDAVVRRFGAPRENTPEILALISKYEPDLKTPVGRPFERVLEFINVIEKVIMQESNLDKRVDLMVTRDVRRQVFLLEGLMKVYKDKFGKAAEKALDRVKGLEDKLGAMSLSNQLLTLATDKGAPPAVIAELKKEQSQVRSELKTLVAEDWSPVADKRDQIPALNKMIKGLSEEKWGGYENDQQYFKAQLADHLKDLEETPYDMDVLQEGIHELRRQLRWTTVFVEASGGMIQLDAASNPLPQFKNLLQDPLATSKYVTLPSAEREQSPVMLSKSLYLANMQAVLDLGAIKDQGEHVEFLSEAYVKAGAASSPEEAQKQVLKLLGRTDAHDVHVNAKKIYSKINDSGLLPALRKQLEE